MDKQASFPAFPGKGASPSTKFLLLKKYLVYKEHFSFMYKLDLRCEGEGAGVGAGKITVAFAYRVCYLQLLHSEKNVYT